MGPVTKRLSGARFAGAVRGTFKQIDGSEFGGCFVMKVAYLAAWASGAFSQKLERLLNRLSPCRLCPRQCNARRLEGDTGLCGQGGLPRVARALPHFGEEPPLTGTHGAGAVFFSGCALRCVFCQNHQISRENRGEEIPVPELAALFLELQAKGCLNLDLVSPTPHLPFIFQALALAIPRGLHIPIVYNSHGYLLPEVLDLLTGLVDIYLPDAKYGSERAARTFSAASDYVHWNPIALKRMYHQVGPLQVGPDGLARRGLLVRHLVLPEDAARSEAVLKMLSRISTRIPLSVMAQYRPCHEAAKHPPLDRPLRRGEYRRVLAVAQSLDFETLFVQSLDSADHYLPDFSRKDPFSSSPSPPCR